MELLETVSITRVSHCVLRYSASQLLSTITATNPFQDPIRYTYHTAWCINYSPVPLNIQDI